MGHAQGKELLSEADYLAGEDVSKLRHEYIAGETHAMAGASERHNLIAGNIYLSLRNASRGTASRSFMADMKLRMSAGRVYYYPDVMLVCNPADNNPLYKESPCLIAEVLSPATAKIDLREKMNAYLAMPGLRYYLVVDSERLWAKCFFRNDADGWMEKTLDGADFIDVRCGEVRCMLSLEELYEDSGLLIQ
jgi:Uma2 family endonuclease